MFGRFKKIIPRYQTEGVSIQSHLQLNVCLDSNMVLQQLLFQPNWERRSKIWCQYISTEIERLKSIQLTASSWRQIFKSSLLYICISIWIFQLMWNICDCFFHCAAWVIIRALLVWRLYNCVYGRFPPHFTLVIKLFKASVRPKSFDCIFKLSYYESDPSSLTDHQAFLVHSQYFVCISGSWPSLPLSASSLSSFVIIV